jgi:protein involved in polysaccharide export with SLBB domain
MKINTFSQLTLSLALTLAGAGSPAQEGIAGHPQGLPGLSSPLPQVPREAPPVASPLPGTTVSPVPEAKPKPEPSGKPGETGQSKDDAAERALKELRQAYKGPFLLGSDLFDGVSGLHQTSMVNVSDDYLLGPGDEMMLYVFGSATFETPLAVDRGGSVTIPRVGGARVAGLRLGDARRVVQRLVNTLYSNSRVDLQFSKTRDVRIFTLGEVYRPGSYVVPSLTSLLNALSAAGGPSPFGSYRSIQLIRAGSVIQTLDLYAIRLKGQGMESLLLRDGDTLFVPIVGVQVLFDGAFIRVASSPVFKDKPGVLVELKPEETAREALQYIGGLLPSAYQGLITLQRTDPNGVIAVENLPLDEAFLRGKRLFTDDKILGLTQAEWTGGVVQVAGHARVAGTFAQRPGMRVADLLREPNQIQPDTYMERGQIVRTHEDGSTGMLVFNLARALRGDPADNLPLEPRDKVDLFKVDDLRLKATVKILGPFPNAGTFDWHEGMRAADLIFAAGTPKLNADRYYAELAHLDPAGQASSEVIKLDLARLLYSVDHPAPGLQDPAVNLLLRPYDQITLYEVPNFKVHHTVSITGQVRRPGPYVLTDKHFTLRQLIDRAGGLTEEAMPKGGIFLRASLREKDLAETDLKKSGIKDLDPTGQGINEILKRLSETKRTKDTGNLLASPVLHDLAEGKTTRLVVDFEAALGGDPRRDVELLDGDQIIIPRMADSAYVVGEVASPFATFRVRPGDSVKDLVKLAGGFTRNADQGEVRLLKADGRIIDGRVLGQAIEPGDAVLVPQRFRLSTSWQDNLQVLTPLALILNAINR